MRQIDDKLGRIETLLESMIKETPVQTVSQPSIQKF